mmetsp:Transcript_146767/g.471151  ORF Transcript_146767/g.471151 Transcript_146767/m.471151 type:complete len:214 (+) Transcript_146767:1656-2297(+)
MNDIGVEDPSSGKMVDALAAWCRKSFDDFGSGARSNTLQGNPTSWSVAAPGSASSDCSARMVNECWSSVFASANCESFCEAPEACRSFKRLSTQTWRDPSWAALEKACESVCKADEEQGASFWPSPSSASCSAHNECWSSVFASANCEPFCEAPEACRSFKRLSTQNWRDPSWAALEKACERVCKADEKQGASFWRSPSSASCPAQTPSDTAP